MSENASDVTILGNGIIGLMTAFALVRDGKSVTVISREGVDTGTSTGNAAAIATAEVFPIAEPGLWKRVPGMLLDPLGPLHLKLSYLPQLAPWLYRFLRACRPQNQARGIAALAAIMARAMGDHHAMLDTIRARELIKGEGAIFVYRSEAGRNAARHEWRAREEHGVEFYPLNRDGILQHEPSLGPEAHCGYYSPDWSHYRDPKELLMRLADWLKANGVRFETVEVTGLEKQDGKVTAVMGASGQRMLVSELVIAAGAWSGRLSKQLDEPFPIEADRGYNTTLPNPGVDLKTYVTFSEDNFVASPLGIGLRIGGAVELAGIEATPNYNRSKALLKLARRYIPDLNAVGGTEWMGHRPGTPDSIPVISKSTTTKNVTYAFGHGHLGLTMSATTGKLVADLIAVRDSGLDMTPYRIDRYL